MRSEAITEVTDSTTHVTKGINSTLILEGITYFLNIPMAGNQIPPGSI